jgi:hypothetical protein
MIIATRPSQEQVERAAVLAVEKIDNFHPA